MAHPKDVSMVSQLKRAAIDAFMADKHMRIGSHPWAYGPRMDPGGWSFRVTTPDAHGRGGGEIDVINAPFDDDEPYIARFVKDVFDGMSPQDHFDRICGRIDRLVEPWHNLPNTHQLEQIVLDLRQHVFEYLSLEASITGAIKSGPMSGYINTLEVESGKLKGDTADTYRLNFTSQMRGVVASLDVIAYSLMIFMAAQQGLWQGAREDFGRLLEDAHDQFHAIAEHRGGGSPGDWVPTTLSVVSIAAGVIAACIPGGPVAAVTALSVVGIVSGAGGMVADAVLPDAPSVKPGRAGSYEQMMILLEQNIGVLNENLKQLEDNIHNNAEVLISGMGVPFRCGNHPYTISDSVIAIDASEADSISMDEQVVNMLAATMREIAGVMGSASRVAKMWHAEIRSAVLRPSSIGRGSIGPSWAVQGLNEALCDRLDDLVSKLLLGADNLNAVSNYHQSKDGERIAALNSLAAEIEAGSGIDATDYSKTEIGYVPTWERLVEMMSDARVRNLGVDEGTSEGP